MVQGDGHILTLPLKRGLQAAWRTAWPGMKCVACGLCERWSGVNAALHARLLSGAVSRAPKVTFGKNPL